jgi:nucleoside-diphosphate-sugar epimerase
MTQALSGASEIHLGNLEPKRDLTFVDDTVRAFMLAANIPAIEGEVVHFGQGKAVSIGELARQCLQVVGSQAKIIDQNDRKRPEKSEVDLLLCNAAKAGNILGWEPQISLQEGLVRTAEYIKRHLDRYRANEYIV